jgi:hypothetical protein
VITLSSLSRTLFVSVALLFGMSAISTSASAANDSEVLECYWLKLQAQKLKTEEAWKKYRECVRSHG